MRHRLTEQLEADCALLESLRVMDYSLLLGIHYRSGGHHLTPLTTDRVSHGSVPAAAARTQAAAASRGGTSIYHVLFATLSINAQFHLLLRTTQVAVQLNLKLT